MNAAAFLRSLVPPITLAVWRRLRIRDRRGSPARPEWERIPEGWVYADVHSEVKGWNVRGVADTNRRKWPRFVELVTGTGPLGIAHESELTTREDLNSQNTILAFAYSLVLAARGRQSISMLDWGGGMGHYCALAQAVLPGTRIEYHCKDMPVLVEEGRVIFPDQHFYSDDTCLDRKYDFILASTSLHYTQDWKKLLSGLSRAAEDYLLVTRLPVTMRSASYVLLQRVYSYGYDTEYLGWCLNRDEFLATAQGEGMSLVREFVIGEEIRIAGLREPCRYRGFLFRRNL